MNDSVYVENYLNMLGGEDQIVYHHVSINNETEDITEATVTDMGRKYHLLLLVNNRTVINRTYPTINSISRILRELQPI
jgi:septum formation inhibitor-activating ATPase MinD